MLSHLRHKTRQGRLAVTNENCETFCNYLPGTNQAQLRSSFGTSRVYRQFLPSFARADISLIFQTRKNQLFQIELNGAEPDASQILNELLMSPTISALPRHGQRNILGTDACGYQNDMSFCSKSNKDKSSVGN